MIKRALPLFAAVWMILSFSCMEKKGDGKPFTRSKNDVARSNRLISQEDIERRALELQTLQAETEELYRLLKDKELMLLRKQASLDSIKLVLEKKEAELLQREKAAKKMRTSGIVLFLAGAAMIFFSLRRTLTPTPKAASRSRARKESEISGSQSSKR